MTVGELKDVLDKMEPDLRVGICVNTPAGWVCPDGCLVDVKLATRGIDWHGWEVLLVPEHELDIHDVEAWSRPHAVEEPKAVKDDMLRSEMTVGECVKAIDEAHEASKGSKLQFD